MIFLFEQYSYKESFLKEILTQDGKDGCWVLPKGFIQKSPGEINSLRLDCVGYLFNANSKYAQKKDDFLHKVIFVLPRVFLQWNEHQKSFKAFGEDIPTDKNFVPASIPTEFLSTLSMRVCSSISKYREMNPQDSDVNAPDAQDFHSNNIAPTLIDVKNAMKRFYDENRNLVVFTAKNKRSGNNRIDWRRTISRTQPVIQNNIPVYADPENRKKVLDLDDRLLVLYFSAMNYIEETFRLKMPKSDFYKPMRMSEFRRLLGHRGLMELRRIKHKYFADKFLKLYNIMKAFFEWGGIFRANNFESEYLLTNKYNNVFEEMIDSLISDELSPEMRTLKEQKDDKKVDHLYKHRQLICANEGQDIWFIGDSKYYLEKNNIEGISVYKQFTYAKNIIQYNISEWLNSDENEDDYTGLRYRDALTEGYSITPNFFIRGFVPSCAENEDERLQQFKDPYFRQNPDSKNKDLIHKDSDEEWWKKRNLHFKNRLFDRDTLLLQAYRINFLYVLEAYTSKNERPYEEFKEFAHNAFRSNFLEFLDENYYFWALYLPNWQNRNYNTRLDKFVKKNFHALAGRIFQAKDTPHCLILAQERNVVDNDHPDEEFKLLNELVKKKCEIFKIDPKDVLNKGKVVKWTNSRLRKRPRQGLM